MRVFNSLPFLPEKSPLVYLTHSSKALFSMPSQALSAGSSLLKVGVGMGGVFSALCPSAIAASMPAAESTVSDTTQPPLLFVAPGTSPSEAMPGMVLPLENRLSLLDAAEVSPNHFPAPELQPLPSLSDEALASAPPSIAAPLQPGSGLVQDQLCQSLQACKGDIAIAIDATSAATLGEPTVSKLAVTDDVAKHDGAASPGSPERVSLDTPLAMSVPSDGDLPKQVKLADLIAEAPANQQAEQTLTQLDQNSETSDRLNEVTETVPDSDAQLQLDDELGIIRAKPLKTRRDDLGILRLLQAATPPPPPKPPIAFLTGRLGYINSDNAFRLDTRLSEQTYQSGLAFRAYPRLSKNTSLYAIAETSLGRFEKEIDRGYNEVELQLGVRQKLFERTYAQFGLLNQHFYTPGYRRSLLNIFYVDTSVSHRNILNKRTTLDSFYQARVGFSDRETSSRIRQTLTFSLNYAATKDLRASLLYQLGIEDYTQIARFDIFQQVIASLSYRITPESRITLFGGTRFGSSSGSIRTVTEPGGNPVLTDINLDDTFYGAELSVNLPLF